MFLMLVILVIMLASCSCNPACHFSGLVVVIVMPLKFPLNLVKFLACVYVT